jgi:MSHA biogenesis protein MshQ
MINTIKSEALQTTLRLFLSIISIGLLLLFSSSTAYATVIEFNNTGGTTATNGLHFYIDDSTQIQVKRLNNTGQVYQPATLPPSANVDNGIFLRANGLVYGPDHNVTTFTPTGGMYSTRAITATSPANPSSSGVQQQATSTFGIASGPQLTVVWKYTTPLDFLTAEVTLVIPAGYVVSAGNPVRYYHVFDTYLGGSDNGCGVKYTDTSGNLVVGTYPPVSGTTCTSSTSIPAGVSVVESFRERSGLTFSNYCASGWSNFWVNGGTNCSILQSTNMSNDIVSTYQDTGIGVQYNFTAPGTYTFSYDFVVGSFVVPPYDHLEIQHSGTANLCAANVMVLACTSSTIPCPAANIVNTGSLTGSVTNIPTTPTVTETPATFTLGSSASTAAVSLLGTSPGGTYTLGTSGLSSVPLNGTKCWNTATGTASCTFVIANSTCVKDFECLETSVAYNNLISSPSARNPLYTKVAGTGFKFDVVALQTSGAISTTYTAASNVTVELFDDSTSPQPACSAYASPIASQAITFATGDAGRKTLSANFNVANAYRKLRCRVRDNNLTPVVYGCSSDEFAVRPTNFTVSATANADSAGSSTTATPIVKTGANFSLTATTGVIGYDGTPSIDNTKLSAHSGATQAGTLSGSFSAASSSTGNATGAAINYNEVGYFRLAANGVYDSSFTAVDSALGDCNSGFTASGSLNACSFSNTTATNYFGRFIPDHFAVTTGTTTPACSSAFSYLGQDGFTTTFTLIAQNSSNATTQNYTGSFAKLGLTTWGNFNFTAGGLPTGATLSASTTTPTGGWSNGTAAINAKHQVSRPTATTSPASITINAAPTDGDGVTMSSAIVSPASAFRYGRLKMQNAYGSELLPLSIPLEAQYWNGQSYIRNQLDSCTVIPASSIALSNYRNNLSACETQIGYSSGTGTLLNGVSSYLRLTKPGATNNGSVDLALNLTSASGSTCTSSAASAATTASIPWFGTDPVSRAAFGIFKTPVIYLRENF